MKCCKGPYYFLCIYKTFFTKYSTFFVYLKISFKCSTLITFLFLLIWCKQSDKKVKCFFFSWFVWLLCFLNTKILQISLRIWELVSDQNFLHLGSWISDDFQFLVTLMSSTFYCVSKLKYRNLNSYFHLLNDITFR